MYDIAVVFTKKAFRTIESEASEFKRQRLMIRNILFNGFNKMYHYVHEIQNRMRLKIVRLPTLQFRTNFSERNRLWRLKLSLYCFNLNLTLFFVISHNLFALTFFVSFMCAYQVAWHLKSSSLLIPFCFFFF